MTSTLTAPQKTPENIERTLHTHSDGIQIRGTKRQIQYLSFKPLMAVKKERKYAFS
jgi:hypothetical protein